MLGPNPTTSPITIHGAAMCGICVVAFAVRLARLSRLDHALCLISSAVSGSYDNNNSNNNRNLHSKSNKLARSVSPLALLCWLWSLTRTFSFMFLRFPANFALLWILLPWQRFDVAVVIIVVVVVVVIELHWATVQVGLGQTRLSKAELRDW